MTVMPEQRLPDHAARLRRVRAQSAWELGSTHWADYFIGIYTGHDDPTIDAEEVYEEDE